MKYDKIIEIFNSQMNLMKAYIGSTKNNEIDNIAIKINRIKLGYMPIIKKDEPDKYLIVPVWDFFGYETITYNENLQNGDLKKSLGDDMKKTYTDDINAARLTINAIDGTIINRNHGY